MMHNQMMSVFSRWSKRWNAALLALAAVLTASFVTSAHAGNGCSFSGAATDATTRSWTNASNWSGCGGTTPQAADTVVILGGKVVELPAGNFTITTMNLDGTLRGATRATTTLTVTANGGNLHATMDQPITFNKLTVNFANATNTAVAAPLTFDDVTFNYTSDANVGYFTPRRNVTLTGNSVFNNQGFVSMENSYLLTIGSGSVFNNGIDTGTGNKTFAINGAVAIDGAFVNRGTLYIGSDNLTLAQPGVFTTDGAGSRILGVNGTVTTNNANLTLSDGYVQGKMTFTLGTGTLNNTGADMYPYTGSASTITVNGNYNQSGGSVTLSVYSPTAFDSLQINGNATVNPNAFSILHDGGYVGLNGRTFDIVTATGSLSATFTSIGTYPSSYIYNPSTVTTPNRIRFTQAAGPSICTFLPAVTGNWANVENWGGSCAESRIPTASDEVSIGDNRSVTLPAGTFEVGQLTVGSYSGLAGAGLGNTTLRVNSSSSSDWLGPNSLSGLTLQLLNGFTTVDSLTLTNSLLSIASSAEFYPGAVTASGTGGVSNGGYIGANGNITMGSGTAFNNLAGGYFQPTSPSFVINGLFDNKGVLDAADTDLTFTNANQFSQTGPGAEFFTGASVTGTTGSLTLQNGYVYSGSSASTTLNFASVVNSGAVINPTYVDTYPTGSVWTINGAYTQSGTGALVLLYCDSESFDHLQINGSANIGGRVEVFLDGFCGSAQGPSRTFTALSSTGTLSGTFSTVTPPTDRTMTVNYDYPAKNVILTFSGVLVNEATVSPNPITFSSAQTVGVPSAPQTVTITNSGGFPFTFASNFGLLDINTAPFQIGPGTCQGATLNPAATCTITVTYTPTAEVTSTYNILNFLAMAIPGTSLPQESVYATGTGVLGAIFTSAAPPVGAVGAAYNHAFTAVGTVSTVTWSVTSGSLPPGLSLNAATGVLNGTPTTQGSYPFVVRVASDSLPATQNVTLVITAALVVPWQADAKIAGGGTHSLGIRSNGELLTWGANNGNALGRAGGNAPSPVTTLGTNVRSVTGAAWYSGAVKNNGDVYAWGWGPNVGAAVGQPAAGTIALPTQVVGLSNMRAISTRYNHTLTLANDGTVWGYGPEASLALGPTIGSGAARQVPGLSNVRQIAAGEQHSMMLLADGTVRTLGANTQGQLGVAGGSQSTPQTVPVSNIVAIAATSFASFAVASDGIVWGWGVGNSTPMQIAGGTGVVAIAAGNAVALARKSDGTVLGWGDNTYGRVGIGSFGGTVSTFTPLGGLSNIAEVAGGEFHSLALRNDGTVFAWGNNNPNLQLCGTAGSDVNAAVNCGLNLSAGAPTITFATSPTSITTGGTSVGTLTVTNPNATPLTASAFTFNYLPGLVNAPAPNASSTCVGATPSAVAGAGNSATSTGFTIPASGSCTFSVTITSSTPAVYAGNISAGLIVTSAGNSNSTPFSLTVTSAAAPVFTASPSLTVAFGNQPLFTTSSLRTVTITNTGAAALNITGWSIFGGRDSSELIEGGTCTRPTTLAPAASCTLTYSFTPTVTTPYSATISIDTNAAGSPHIISISGTGTTGGTAPVIGAIPSLTTYVGDAFSFTPSATSATAVTWSRSGNLPPGLTFNTSNGNISGTPTTTGNYSLTLTATNAGGSATASFSLAVIVRIIPVISLSSNSLGFGNQNVGTTSPAQTVTVTNAGNGAFDIRSITGIGDFAFSSNCSGSLSPNASCTITVTFRPLTVGPLGGVISVNTTAQQGDGGISLSGTGVKVPTPNLIINPQNLTFADRSQNTTSPAQTIFISNTGDADLTLGAISINGLGFIPAPPLDTDNPLRHPGCGSAVAAGRSCVIGVAFSPPRNPLAVGPLTGSVSFTHNSTPGGLTTATASIGLSGRATLVLEPRISVSGGLAFADTTVGSRTAPQNITVTNTGTANLIINNNITVSPDVSNTITSAGEFPAIPTGCGTLAPNGTCSISVVFAPSGTEGAKLANLNIASNAANAANTSVRLSGTALAEPIPIISLSSTSLNFGTVNIGSSPATQTITVSNDGVRALIISGVSVAAPYSQTNTCIPPTGPGSLARGSTCTITVGFSPGQVGEALATLTVASNAGRGTNTVALSGAVSGPGCRYPVPAAFRIFVPTGCLN